jgi:serine/threonine-protein kinase
LTETGTTLGTLAYMSPEQAKGDELDRRSDVFSLGVVLYELLTGHLPFEADQQPALLYRIVNDEPEPLISHRPELEQGLQHIVDKALAKDLEARYSRAQEFLEDLKNWQSGRQIARPRRKRRRVGTKTLIWAGVGIAIVIALYGISTRLPAPQSDGPEIASLAVLPFRNAITDPEQEFLTEGITDELIARLAQIGSIRVIARRSVMGYADTDKSLSEIAAELNVDALVEGSIRIVDDRLRVTAELANPNESDALWGDTFDRSVSNALALPGDIALAIARAAGVTLTAPQESRIGGATQVDPAVYKAYRTGLRASEEWSTEAWQKGIKYFNEAIDLDPTFAPAYAGLSRCYGFMGWFDPNPDYEAVQKAAALEAIELDESLADGYAALADYYYRKIFDWDAAEAAFRRALELEPGSASSQLEYGNFLILAGRSDEGIEHLIKARELDPLSLEANRELGLGYLNARRYDEAIEYLINMRGVFPEYVYTEWFLALCYSGKGLHDEAIATIENASAGESDNVLKAMSPDIYARAGRVDDALRILEGIKETAQSKSDILYAEFKVYALLGRYDEAFAAAEKLYKDSPTLLLYINIEPLPPDLRADPRYQDLLSRVGLGKRAADNE